MFDVAFVEAIGAVLVLVYVERGDEVRVDFSSPRIAQGTESLCRRARKLTGIASSAKCLRHAPSYDPEDGPYDPNDLKAVEAYWKTAIVDRRPGRPLQAVTRTMVSLRIDPDVLAALRVSGRGWQTRVNALLREAVKKGRV